MDTNTQLVGLIGIVIFSIVLSILVRPLLRKPKQDSDDHGTFTSREIFTLPECQLFSVLERYVPDTFGPDAKILTRVLYTDFLHSDDASSQARINRKRADFVVVTPQGRALCVIEYIDPNHYGDDPEFRDIIEYRDRVKRSACDSAGIPYLEISAGFSSIAVRDALRTTLA